MELRYVYRKIEDAIGVPFIDIGNPHNVITQKIRFDYRENRDLARINSLKALCLSAESGNPRVDVQKSSRSVSDMLISAIDLACPYLQVSKNATQMEDDLSKYDKYFKKLREMRQEKR